ncbi:MAG TPA: D-alanyl-D-alanine carboxypeptidase/D-alanyl-D-alanine-endopeptidase, partial [Vicinamibacteria bacterium]|nr:D-alanyl-D-alanine carboxypeptidase/D-alanyl-D-alanine-endopeptidase [Vicinamibacteria bacterium]
MRPNAGAFALLLVLGPAALGAEPQPAALRRAITPIVERPELATAFWGIEVRGLKSGRTLFALNPARAFRPASTLKLVTTAAALDVLGPGARPRTTVLTAARTDALGRVLGDVYLVGGGDPNLSARFSPGRPTAAFEEMADALVAGGVRGIEGRLIGHEGAFSGEGRGGDWTWEDLAWGYGAPVSALSFNDGLVELRLAPGERPGDPALLQLAPQTPLLAVASAVATAAAGTASEVRLERAPGSNEVRLLGALPIGASWSGEVAVEDPARFAVTAFAAALESRGIRLADGVSTSRAPLPPGTRVLAAHDGVPLSEEIRVVNKESQNLHAETLFRLLGLRAAGEGSVEKGREAVGAFLQRLGVPTSGWQVTDGCGLARTDLVTPQGLVSLLVAMDGHPQAAAFRDSLPVAGRDGTLATRLRGTPAEGRVQAKTGSLNLVNALAGYATARDGERVAFAILVNNHAGRS